ncbi:MAG: helix-turn-helix domain-containing protein [Chloroflexi bacterium]|nr:helix-turn-helix domain-containing protein [Chloroflexota bacterium]MDA1147030.1 helix-turn-helix domain-containing protein [Chloroflexota bacterium]
MAGRAVGALVRDWRMRRRRSQMDVALDVGVSTRHLSFVETGRSNPSPELLVAIADELAVPLRERNSLLLAAGYAPRYAETPLDDAAMGQVRSALQRMLDSHQPYPGAVIDRMWNVVLSNQAGLLLVGGAAPELLAPPVNVFRVSLHPDGMARQILNFDEWACYLLGELRRATSLSGAPELEALLAEVSAYPNVAALGGWREAGDLAPTLLVPLRLAVAGTELSLITTLTRFGSPQDVTLSELAVELFFPADDATGVFLRGLQTASETATALPGT